MDNLVLDDEVFKSLDSKVATLICKVDYLTNVVEALTKTMDKLEEGCKILDKEIE